MVYNPSKANSRVNQFGIRFVPKPIRLNGIYEFSYRIRVPIVNGSQTHQDFGQACANSCAYKRIRINQSSFVSDRLLQYYYYDKYYICVCARVVYKNDRSVKLSEKRFWKYEHAHVRIKCSLLDIIILRKNIFIFIFYGFFTATRSTYDTMNRI